MTVAGCAYLDAMLKMMCYLTNCLVHGFGLLYATPLTLLTDGQRQPLTGWALPLPLHSLCAFSGVRLWCTTL